MNFAAASAVDWSSANTSMFIAVVSRSFVGCWRLLAHDDRVLPASRRRNSINLSWAPGIWLVGIDRRGLLQHGIDDSPGFFHVVFAGKQSGVADHGIAQDTFVGIHFLGGGLLARDHLRGLSRHLLVRPHDGNAHSNRDIRANPEAEII